MSNTVLFMVQTDTSVGKVYTCDAGDPSLIPVWEDLLKKG